MRTVANDETAGTPVRTQQPATLDDLAARLTACGPTLLAAARILTRNDAEAEDAVQTTFEIALRRLDTLRDPDALLPWLVTIETREALRTMRRLRRTLRLDTHVFEPADASDRIDRSAHSTPTPLAPPGHFDRTERILVRDALRSLPPKIRAAIVLHYLAGYSVSEAARELGVSENAIKTQLKDGLRRLREVLRDE